MVSDNTYCQGIFDMVCCQIKCSTQWLRFIYVFLLYEQWLQCNIHECQLEDYKSSSLHIHVNIFQPLGKKVLKEHKMVIFWFNFMHGYTHFMDKILLVAPQWYFQVINKTDKVIFKNIYLSEPFARRQAVWYTVNILLKLIQSL